MQINKSITKQKTLSFDYFMHSTQTMAFDERTAAIALYCERFVHLFPEKLFYYYMYNTDMISKMFCTIDNFS